MTSKNGCFQLRVGETWIGKFAIEATCIKLAKMSCEIDDCKSTSNHVADKRSLGTRGGRRRTGRGEFLAVGRQTGIWTLPSRDETNFAFFYLRGGKSLESLPSKELVKNKDKGMNSPSAQRGREN